MRSEDSAALPGSSPLTRGKLGAQLKNGGTSRLIPAHAGKTAGRAGGLAVRRAHPRSRGENVVSLGRVGERPGSSPLTRGKRSPRDSSRRSGRLIPAHAGKTTGVWLAPNHERAHPRSRGENDVYRGRTGVRPGSSPLTRGKHTPNASYKRERGGSSPLTRGKPFRHVMQLRQPGLIPAHAGKTCKRPRAPESIRAHPRSRGENFERLGRG